jgi:hypothetical protein
LDLDENYKELELDDEKIVELNSNHVYHVISSEDLEKEEKELNSKEYFFEIQNRIEKSLNARKEFIKQNYQPLHPHLYTFSESFLDDSLLKFLNENEKEAFGEEKIKSFLTQLTDTGLYIFPCFKKEFCDQFIEEIKNYESKKNFIFSQHLTKIGCTK